MPSRGCRWKPTIATGKPNNTEPIVTKSDRMAVAGRVMLNFASVTEGRGLVGGVYPRAEVGYQDLWADAVRKDGGIVLHAR